MYDKKEIDIVITWVDGNDATHQQKIKPYLLNPEQLNDDIAGPTRFRSEGEIFYCVASIFRFAPFIRKIFVVTDQQDPKLNDFILKNFPESNIGIEIIDHKVIFKGFGSYLPVFNSLSIETCLYRIPGLSENFVYFNDDFFLTSHVQPDDWFTNDKVVAYGYWRSIILDQILRLVKPRKNGHKPFGYKDSILNAATIAGKKQKYFYMMHSPQPLKKSIFEKFYTVHPDIFTSNISHKFRQNTQFNPQALFYLIAFDKNMCIRNQEKKTLFIKPVSRGKSYIERKIKDFENDQDIHFCCIESIDMAPHSDQVKIFKWLQNLLEINF